MGRDGEYIPVHEGIARSDSWGGLGGGWGVCVLEGGSVKDVHACAQCFNT